MTFKRARIAIRRIRRFASSVGIKQNEECRANNGEDGAVGDLTSVTM